jgi:hypothetical protein
MEVLQAERAGSGGCLAPDRQDLLLRLFEQRRQAEMCSSSGKRHAPPPPDFRVSIFSDILIHTCLFIYLPPTERFSPVTGGVCDVM